MTGPGCSEVINLDFLRALRHETERREQSTVVAMRVPHPSCNFCGRAKSEVAQLVGEPGRFICNFCFEACAAAIASAICVCILLLLALNAPEMPE